MTKQTGIIRISGRLGDKVYYYRKDKKNRKQYFIRQAPVVVSQTAATKKAAVNFGIASKSSRLIRHTLREHTQKCYDNTLHYRLNTIIRADNSLQSLKNFRFNSKSLLEITTVVERDAQGHITVSIAGNAATHLSVKVIGVSVNLRKQIAQQVIGETMLIKQGESFTDLKLNINSRNNTLILLEVQSQNRKENALDVIAVLPAQQPTKKRLRSKAPKLWGIPPYPSPVKRPRLIVYGSPPED